MKSRKRRLVQHSTVKHDNQRNNIISLCNICDNISAFFFVIIILPHVICSSNFNTECRISDRWWGRYHQSGLGNVEINESHVTTKGICTNQTKDFFVFFDRNEDCYYCLVMLRRHRNIIEYRESHCVRSNSQSICSHMQVETPMHTLVRENADAIKCPMSGVYFFSINDPMREPCSSMDSVAKPCVGRTRYRMLLNKCNHAFTSQNDELYMECIGQWTDGSDTYLYVRMSSPDLKDLDDMYRCLRYHSNGFEMHAAMSADATCRGLRSSQDGPYVLKLHRNVSSLPDYSCQFPDWLDDITWFDRERNIKVRLDKEAGILTEYKKFNWEPSSSSLLSNSKWMPYEQSVELRCFSTNDEESDDFLAIIGNNHQCNVKVQCLRLARHSKSILSLAKSDLEKVAGDPSICLKVRYEPHQVLFADHVFSASSICSFPGIYHVTNFQGCSGRVLVGCQRNTQISVDRNCDEQTELFECSASWSDRGKTIIVARKLRLGSLHCFVIDGNVKTVYFDEECSKHNEHQKYYAFPAFEPCQSHPPYILFTLKPSIPPGQSERFTLPADDEIGSSGNNVENEDIERPSTEGKREKHIYLSDNNLHVTVDGIWEVRNVNEKQGIQLPRSRCRIIVPSFIFKISLILCFFKLLQ